MTVVSGFLAMVLQSGAFRSQNSGMENLRITVEIYVTIVGVRIRGGLGFLRDMRAS